MGERNLYRLGPKGAVLCDAASEEAMIAQIACALGAGNRALLDGPPAEGLITAFDGLAFARAAPDSHFEAVLTDRSGDDLVAFLTRLAAREGRIVSVHRVDADTLRADAAPVDLLLEERSTCINTTAAGGNASLMSIG